MILFTLQALPVAVPPAPGWASPQVLLALGTMLVTVIGALAAAVVQVLRELRSTRADVQTTKTLVATSAQVGAAVGEHRDKKLDRIEVLVNGRYSEVLQELATLRHAIAAGSGAPLDQALAAAAQSRADNQINRVAALLTPTPTPSPEGR